AFRHFLSMETRPLQPKVSPFRLILVGAGILLAAALLIQQLGRLLADRSIMPPDDFVEYWAAGRLNAQGENPYDGAKLLPLEKEAGRVTFPVDSSGNENGVMMWKPAWALPVGIAVGFLVDMVVACVCGF